MVAAVRGTSFGVSLDPQKSLVVTEGTVRAQQRDPETGTPRPETEVLVQAGNTLEDDGERFVVRVTTETDRDDWYIENNPTDDADSNMVEVEPPKLVIPLNEAPEPVACTADVFQCPGGSFVSRVAPSCDFATCPVVTEQVACTEEAMICPDGSTVGREGPNCEFAACPPIEEPEVLKVSVSRVEPAEFDYDEDVRILFYGENLDQVTKVMFDNERVNFVLSNQGIIGVMASELSNQDESYDVTLETETDTIVLNDAVEIRETAPLLVLEIETISSGLEDSLEFVIVTGPGMDIVDTVLVNGDDALDWDLFSDTELHIFDTFLQNVSSVTVSGQGLSDTATP